jgi:hypothetical protein
MDTILRLKLNSSYFLETTYEFKANEYNCVDVIYVTEDNLKYYKNT